MVGSYSDLVNVSPYDSIDKGYDGIDFLFCGIGTARVLASYL